MALPNRTKALPPSEEPIVVHDSDSEPETVKKNTHKRRKTSIGHPKTIEMSEDMSMNIDPEFVYPTPLAKVKPATEKNAHLKGRKRFNADLHDMKEECTGGIVQHGFRIKNIRAGDDEGSIEVIICDDCGEHIVNLLVSDTSDYPNGHSFFSYSPDTNLPPYVSQAVESVASENSRSIRQTIYKLLGSLGGVDDGGASQEAEMEDDEGSDVDYDAYDAYDGVGITGSDGPKVHMQKLQNDFIETVATGFRPGLIRFGGDDFSISVSLPVIILAASIPPRALMAWDRRLLSRSQHLCLLISGFRGNYPAIGPDGMLSPMAQQSGTALNFKVGLTPRYKPGQEFAKEAVRTFGLIINDTEDKLRIQAEKATALESFDYDNETDTSGEPASQGETTIEEDEGRFDRFSLSSSLESLLDHALLKVLQIRRQFGLRWAGAEVLFGEVERTQMKAEDIYNRHRQEIIAADKAEAELGRTNPLPHDPLLGLAESGEINLTLTAFCYLVRRLTLCTRYCIVCHNKLNNDFEALKPYVCDSKLCAYQYYSLNRGPSLEYEIIHNPQTVDLLVSIAHSAASEGVIDETLPIGMALRVPRPDMSKVLAPSTSSSPDLPGTAFVGSDRLCDFDDLSLPEMRVSIVQLIDSLPSVEDMKRHLERKVKAGKSKPRLKDLDPVILPAAWSILRWCVASCTAYLEEISSGEECVRGLDPAWRQFRFSVGAPDAEAKFQAAVREAQASNRNAQIYPSLFAFHGSPLRNWHSIIRHGLWYKQITHGRAYGNGVYLAKEGNLSMGSYATPGRSTWRKTKICPTNCVALAEIVNLPSQFVSNNPHFVIKDTHWIVCRYLLVKCAGDTFDISNDSSTSTVNNQKPIPLVKLDPTHLVTLNGTKIMIPEPSHQIDTLLTARRREYAEEENDEEDLTVFKYKQSVPEVIEINDDDEGGFLDEDDDRHVTSPRPAVTSKGKEKATERRSAPLKDDWKHNPEWVNNTIAHLMPPPLEATPSATMAVQRELAAMLKEQENAKSLKELGWYMPRELIGDNLFQWIVEIHSFDETLPVAKDLKQKKLNSIIFEIRFPPAFPLSPPFFRIITPRFLPFIQGGGGHITGGGSICMDLLTADGWLPSYSISAVLMQIKLAISNLDPRPARLSSDYDRPYGVSESLIGFKRAAATHGWQIPVGIDKLVR